MIGLIKFGLSSESKQGNITVILRGPSCLIDESFHFKMKIK